MKFLPIAFIALCVSSLLGCGSSGEDELRQWMSDERAQARPRVTPIAEPKQFNPQPYTADAGMEPFNSLKLNGSIPASAV